MDEFMITGHQWGDNGVYVGQYDFPANKDQESVHLPPNTTLTAPPDGLAVDQEAAWDGAQWVVRNVTMQWMPDSSQYSENYFGIPEAASEVATNGN